jgi:hypothetical protein
LIATHCIENRLPLLYSDKDFDPFVEHLGLRPRLPSPVLARWKRCGARGRTGSKGTPAACGAARGERRASRPPFDRESGLRRAQPQDPARVPLQARQFRAPWPAFTRPRPRAGLASKSPSAAAAAHRAWECLL